LTAARYARSVVRAAPPEGQSILAWDETHLVIDPPADWHERGVSAIGDGSVTRVRWDDVSVEPLAPGQPFVRILVRSTDQRWIRPHAALLDPQALLSAWPVHDAVLAAAGVALDTSAGEGWHEPIAPAEGSPYRRSSRISNRRVVWRGPSAPTAWLTRLRFGFTDFKPHEIWNPFLVAIDEDELLVAAYDGTARAIARDRFSGMIEVNQGTHAMLCFGRHAVVTMKAPIPPEILAELPRLAHVDDVPGLLVRAPG
jgi:hypothetical protein